VAEAVPLQSRTSEDARAYMLMWYLHPPLATLGSGAPATATVADKSVPPTRAEAEARCSRFLTAKAGSE